MKRTVKIIAVAAAAACVLGIAGCSSSNNLLALDSYWYVDTYPGIQPASIDGTPEVLVYDLLFDEESGGNTAFKVNYYTDDSHDHYFKTTFTATYFDWSDENLTCDGYRLSAEDISSFSESDKARLDGTQEVVYKLVTEMRVSGEYIYTGSGADENDNSVEFSDYMITTTYFRSSRNSLQPVYSKQEVHSTSPVSMNPSSKDRMCTELKYDYEVFYNFGCTEATYVYTEYDTENGEVTSTETKRVSGLQSTGYTMFDNNTLYTALRGMSLSSDFSATVSLLIPADGGITNCSISGTDSGELDAKDDADIVKALTDAYGTSKTASAEDDEDSEETRTYINYTSVSISAADELGTSQTAWFATVEDEDDNQYRATMLYLSVPLSYNLGTVEYRLSEIQSVLGGKV